MMTHDNQSDSSTHDPLSSQFVSIPTNDDETVSPKPDPLLNPNSNSLNSILEPPSYADAVFQSFDHSPLSPNSPSNGHDHSPLSLQSTTSFSSSSDYLNISVSDPQKETELSGSSLVPGGTYYFSYLITTFTDFDSYSGTEFNVRRRFKDVVALADRLAESFRGFCVPLRPDKSVVESQVMQQHEFVEQRRVALEKYLRQLAGHPVIRKSEELRVFLTVSGKMPLLRDTDVALLRDTDVASRVLDGVVRLPKQIMGAESVGVGGGEVTEVVRPAKGGMDLLRMFKELKQSVTNDWGGVKPPLVEEDKEFLERKEKLGEFEQQLSVVSQQAESLVKAQQDIGEAMGQLGLSFVKLTKFETEEAMFDSQRARSVDMKNMATASVKASRLYRELNAQTVKHLDKLHEYLGVMLAVNNAFADRSSALVTVQTILSDLASLNSRIEKLEAASSKIFGGDSSRLRKIDELRETVRLTENSKDCAVREYERIKENNRNELARLDKERHDDFVSMLKGFVVNQAGYAEKMANVWESVAEETSGYVQK